MICSVEYYLFLVPEGQAHGHPVPLTELLGFLWAQRTPGHSWVEF